MSIKHFINQVGGIIKIVIGYFIYILLIVIFAFFCKAHNEYKIIIKQNKDIKYDIKHVNKKIDNINDHVLILNQLPKLHIKKITPIEQNIIKCKKQKLISYKKNIVSPKEEQYYNFIITHNSYSNPLTEKEIWNIIDTLKKCKNDPILLLSIAEVESSFNKDAVSKSGCLGLMQINPIHSKKYNFENADLFDPCKSILIADKLISDWKMKNNKLTTEAICQKYLGCYSKKYILKVMRNMKKIKVNTYCET